VVETEARQLSIIDTAVMRYSAQGGKCWWGRGAINWVGHREK